MEKTLAELAVILKGKLTAKQPEMIIKGVNGLEEATSEQISFAVPPYLEVAGQSHAAALVIPEDAEFTGAQPVIRVANPRAAFAQLLVMFRPPEEVDRVISAQAFVSPQAKIGKNVAIQPFAVIEAGAEIGDDTIIYPNCYVGKHVKIGAGSTLYPSVTVRENCLIGKRVILQAGCVIGGDGFGFVTTNGKHTKVLQTGNVVIGDDVEVGCNTCIDRATVDSTIVGAGTKIDNLVHLGHNDIIGENCLLVAHADLPKVADAFYSINIGKIGKIFATLKEHQVQQVTMIGKVTKEILYSEGKIVPDWQAVKLLMGLPDRHDDTIMNAIVAKIQAMGIEVLDQTLFITALLPEAGVLSKRKPNAAELADMEYGFAMAKKIGGLDIGQTVVVKNKAIMAVEAIEGTDACILRGGKLGKDVIVAKTAKPAQDNRFDMPSVGVQTIKSMLEAGAAGIVMEAGRTLLVEREKVLELANAIILW